MPRPKQEIINEALAGTVICNIGQVDKETQRALDKLVRAGTLAKWRGYWYPTPGANWGIGPLKSCWGLPAYLSCPATSNPSPLNVGSAA